MKIYRVLGKKEEKALLDNNDILFEHKTVLRKDWIVFDHEEDYRTGKFFFFTIEDACVFLRYAGLYNLNDSIIEMDIDEREAFKYIGFGVYCYGDYDMKGNWDGYTSHDIPELFLPYNLIKEKLKNNEYRLITYEDREHADIVFPYNKNRGRYFLELGKIMLDIFLKRDDIKYLRKRVEKPYSEEQKNIDLKELRLYEEKLEENMRKLPEVYSRFVEEHNKYVCPVKENKKQLR